LIRLVAAFVCALLASDSFAAELSSAGVEFFENKIRPVLAQDCYECHRTDGRKKGGLALDTREALLRGGDTGPGLVPGDPAKSLLIQAIRHELPDTEMPKARAKLDDSVIKNFEQWVKMGAPDPRDKPPTEEQMAADTNWASVLERRKNWWSFQPIRKSEPPAGQVHPIDRFIRAKLAEAKLPQAAPADRAVLIRRLSFALRGLPPSLEEIRGSKSFTELADDFLASPRYGERWARHWMDWFRYADSHGSEGDAMIPNAWQYRDYLIRALNADVPYDQLIREHLAGDLLAKPRINTELGLNESAIGPANLRMVFHGFSPTDALEELVRFTDDEIGVISKATLAMTVSCARCHDHKFDPISQADFTAWYGIFSSPTPALVDVNAPSAEADARRKNLERMKAEIKSALAASWLKSPPALTDEIKKEAAKTSPSELTPLRRWALTNEANYAEWKHDGPSVQQIQPAGAFAIAPSGDSILTGIYPSGIYSHLLSNKDRGFVLSPQFPIEAQYDLWLRVAGDGSSAARYVVHNYPRDGAIYPVNRLSGGRWQWMKYNLNYWEGDRLHIELATAADLPVMADLGATRSWFGMSDAVVVKAGSPAPTTPPGLNESDVASEEAFAARVRAAINAWQAGKASDADALLLDFLLQKKALANDLASSGEIRTLVTSYREEESKLPMPTRAPGVLETAPADQPLFVRGNHKKPAEMVPRHFLDAIDAKPYAVANSGRLQLAEDIFRPDNPLAARVIVNRVWHHLFGRGIVATPDNFGRLGQPPSHPELLDCLATWFVENGYSIKKLARFIVTSQTWQAASDAPRGARERDPDNALLSHFSVRRLEAEAIRDSLLAVSGELKSDAMYGPPINGREPRRSVYLRVKRNDLDPFMTAFDVPAPASTTGKRDVTNVPAQSLLLLNDPFVIDLAQRWADREGANITALFERALDRKPTDGELARMQTLLEQFREDRASADSEHAALQKSIETQTSQLDALSATARERVLGQRPPNAHPVPQPIAAWDFRKSLNDQIGSLHLKLVGSAKQEKTGLLVEGGMAASSPLPVTLKTKTLEAWVRLANFEQQGGGAITVQDLNGDVFDSIVYGERESRRWMAGSDFGRRTDSFYGPAEESSDFVHVLIAYAADGTITGYRNGVPYGKAYKSNGPFVFEAGKSQMLFGNRHGSPAGNRPLRGQILQARLYDRALTGDEAYASFTGDPNFVSFADVLAALTSGERAEFDRLKSALIAAKENLETMNRQRGLANEWGDLAHAIFNLKEFVYVR
jgi:hypothetical protein